jgi:hypothetical protein
MKPWMYLAIALMPGGSVVLLVAWAWKHWQKDRVSPLWLLQLRQGARDEFHGPTVKGPFGGSR